MKLISFAALSLLAITVSAQTPRGSASRGAQHSYDNRMGAGISKVKQDYEAAESWVIKLGDDAKKTKAALVKLSESITGIKTKLQGTGLTDKQKEVLKEYYDEFRKIFKELSLVRGKQLKSFEDARHERDEAKMLFDSFMGIR